LHMRGQATRTHAGVEALNRIFDAYSETITT
jgi:hypothetical protein